LLPTIPQNYWTDSKSSKFVSACADTTAQSSYLHQSARVEQRNEFILIEEAGKMNPCMYKKEVTKAGQSECMTF
jgi:hypothetical protein